MADKSFGLRQLNLVGVGTPSIESSTDLVVNTNGSERVRILSGGNIGIGLTNPDTELHIKTNSATGPTIRLEGTAPMGADDLIGGIDFFNIDGSGNGPQVGVSLRAYTEGAGGNGGYLIVGVQDSTTGSEGADTQEAFRVTTAGNIAFPSGQGIDFSATANSSATMDSEILHDYEEGTWSPTFQGESNNNNPTISYATRRGRYTKIGRYVCVHGFLQCNTVSNTGTTLLQIGNFPFTVGVDSDTNHVTTVNIGQATSYSNSSPSGGYLRESQNGAYLTRHNGTSWELIETNHLTNTSTVFFTINYITSQ